MFVQKIKLNRTLASNCSSSSPAQNASRNANANSMGGQTTTAGPTSGAVLSANNQQQRAAAAAAAAAAASSGGAGGGGSASNQSNAQANNDADIFVKPFAQS